MIPEPLSPFFFATPLRHCVNIYLNEKVKVKAHPHRAKAKKIKEQLEGIKEKNLNKKLSLSRWLSRGANRPLHVKEVYINHPNLRYVHT